MQRTHRLALAVGVLALGWTVGAAGAQTPSVTGVLLPAAAVADAPAPGPMVVEREPYGVFGHPVRPDSGAANPIQPVQAVAVVPAAAEPNVGVVPAAPGPSAAAVMPNGWLGEPDQSDWGHVAGGAGVYFLKTFGQGEEAFTTQTATVAPAGVGVGGTTSTATTVTPISHGPKFAPLLWLGYVTPDGFGARVRWWWFSESSTNQTSFPQSTTPAPAVGVPVTTTTIGAAEPFGLEFVELASTDTAGDVVGPATVTAAEQLRLSVWDFELTEDFAMGAWRGLVACGGRYGMLSNTYLATGSSVTLAPVGRTTTLAETLGSHSDFNGVGPTLALEVRRCLGGPRLSIFADVRGSLLFGTIKQGGFDLVATTVVAPSGAQTVGISADTQDQNRNQAVPVGELELGAEWSRCIGGCTPFVRAAVVGQTWMSVGTATNVDGDLSFIGFTLTAGVSF